MLCQGVVYYIYMVYVLHLEDVGQGFRFRVVTKRLINVTLILKAGVFFSFVDVRL